MIKHVQYARYKLKSSPTSDIPTELTKKKIQMETADGVQVGITRTLFYHLPCVSHHTQRYLWLTLTFSDCLIQRQRRLALPGYIIYVPVTRASDTL